MYKNSLSACSVKDRINMLYPIKFTPVYKSKIWGGTKLSEVYAREIPGTDIGEAWEITCRDDGMGIVQNGPLQGMEFARLFETYKTAITGHIKLPDGKFPLLLKLLDVNSDLSVQVHPTLDFIKKNSLSGEEEKNEMWYVLYAEDTARMVSGLKDGVTRDIFAEAVKDERIEDCLEFTPVKTGDVIMIRAGSVHAACAGMFLFELQQSSDTTYRIYDYRRKDQNGNERRLDVEKALDTINYEKGVTFLPKPEFTERQGFRWRRLAECPEFYLTEVEVDSVYMCRNNKTLQILTSLKGNTVIKGNSVEVELKEGESVMIPACLKIYTVIGGCTLLCSTIKPPPNFM